MPIILSTAKTRLQAHGNEQVFTYEILAIRNTKSFILAPGGAAMPFCPSISGLPELGFYCTESNANLRARYSIGATTDVRFSHAHLTRGRCCADHSFMAKSRLLSLGIAREFLSGMLATKKQRGKKVRSSLGLFCRSLYYGHISAPIARNSTTIHIRGYSLEEMTVVRF